MAWAKVSEKGLLRTRRSSPGACNLRNQGFSFPNKTGVLYPVAMASTPVYWKKTGYHTKVYIGENLPNRRGECWIQPRSHSASLPQSESLESKLALPLPHVYNPFHQRVEGADL